MNKKIKRWLSSFLITLPLAFVLIFFGFLPPHFDIVVYTDNIVGEGMCRSFLADENTSFAYLYYGDAYFGSELKTLRLTDLAYNVESVDLYMYGIEQADFVSYDISLFGIAVTHVSNKPGSHISHPFTLTATTAVTTDEEPLYHLENTEGLEEMAVSFPGNSLIPFYVWILYGSFIMLVALMLSFLVVAVLERAPGLRPPLMGAAAICVTMIMGCFLCGSLPYVDYTDFLLNWVLLFAVALLINSLTLPWLGTVLVSVFTLFWYIANHFVIQFRNKPIMPADLKAFGTAKEVMGGYDLIPTWKMIVSVIVVLLFLTAMISIWVKTKKEQKIPQKKRQLTRIVGVITAIVLIVFSVNNPAFAQLNDFQWDARVLEGFHREGIVLTFVKSAISGHVKRPEGYSREAVSAYLNEYQMTEREENAIRPTRIIMVMNEAFSDLRTVGLDESIDVMPFIDSLDENTIEGSLYVSVLGGGTCNTEFEALTGNTLAFLGPGAYPYTENVTKPLFSLASYFRDNGYATEAFHANKASNWNRNIVYPNLGFTVFHPLSEYTELSPKNFLHAYITDATDYAFIEKRDKEIESQPRFLFNVTIQNHADYDHFQDVQQAETLEPYKDSLHQNARVYLSLIKVSDDSIRDLVEHYTESNEPTMIVFFGDHQPAFPQDAYNQVYTNLEKYLDSFKSKFFIWTNYETETVHEAEISANYLPWLILKRGNFPLSPYVQMLEEVHEKYPIISSQGVVDTEGNVYDNVAMLLDDPLIRKYQYIQYANLFDEIDPAWFEVP